MVVDTSVLLHIALAEPGWESSAAFLLAQQSRLLAAPSYVEAHAVLTGRTIAEPHEVLDQLLQKLFVEVVPFTSTQALAAASAYTRYGKGQGHAARLNFGDVMAYALAKDRGQRLAYTGNDFDKTDLECVRLPVSDGIS